MIDDHDHHEEYRPVSEGIAGFLRNAASKAEYSYCSQCETVFKTNAIRVEGWNLLCPECDSEIIDLNALISDLSDTCQSDSHHVESAIDASFGFVAENPSDFESKPGFLITMPITPR